LFDIDMKRREFFHSFRSSQKTEPQEHQPREEVSLLAVSRFAMAGDFELSFPGNRFPQGTASVLEVLDQVQRLEKKLSAFLSDSQVEYINKVAAYEPVPLDEELFCLISFCQEISEETGGAIDITSTSLWKLWGFFRRDMRVPTETEITAALQTVGHKFIELEAQKRTIRLTKPGVALSFGCVGKGLALDVASRALLDNGVTDFIFHGSLSSVLAHGSLHEEPRQEIQNTGWVVGIAHPMLPGERLAEVRLCNESLGTSGSQKQFFRHQGRRFSHILDPRTGYPVEKTLQVSVAAPQAMQADVLSTAFFVMAPEEVSHYCEKHPEIAVFLVTATDRSPGFEIQTFGWTEEALRIF